METNKVAYAVLPAAAPGGDRAEPNSTLS